MHVSPFLSRSKPDSDKRRIILDLSFPKAFAVNSCIPKDIYLETPFVLKLPTVDDIIRKIMHYGKGSHIFKIDIGRAFRHVKIDPRDYKLLGVKVDDYYVDSCLPFGFRQGTSFFQRISDAVRFMTRQRNVDVINYVDDICCFSTVSTSYYKYLQVIKLLKS